MTCYKPFLIIILLFLSFFKCYAQVDTSFWFAAPAVTSGHENRPIVFKLSTYSQPADIAISQPANPNFIPYITRLNSNAATTIDVTNQINQIENTPGNTIKNFGLKITATANISAYYEVGERLNPEIFPLKGKIGLGTSFIIPAQTRFANRTPLTPMAHSGFIVVATEDNTDITVTLTQPDSIGHAAGVPFTIILNKGQSYAVIAASSAAGTHMGGSFLKSTKPVAVTIYDDSLFLNPNYDLIGDQIVPIANTGNEFIIVKGALSFSGYPNVDFFYVWATADNTQITVDGNIVATINLGQSYEGVLANATAYITTTNPVYVLQFTGIAGEVAATSLPNIKCTGSSTVSFVRSTTETFFLNILCKTTDINGFQLNGQSGIITPSLFSPVAGTNGIWHAARISSSNLSNLNALIPAGVATQVTNSLGLFHLGFLNGGTSTGLRLGYFSNYGIAALTPLVVNNICFGSNLQLQANLIANTSYTWSGPNGFTSNIYNPTIANATVADSGMYYVTANVQGCGSFTDSLPIAIFPAATATFGADDTLCNGSSKVLNITLTGKAPWTVYYNDGTKSDTIKQITTSPYLLTVSPKITSTYAITKVIDGTTCVSTAFNKNDSITVVVNPFPTASISGGDILCIGKSKTLNVALTGKAPWAIVYNNGINTFKVNDILLSPYSFTVAPTANVTYTVTYVSDANGCSNTQPISYPVNVFARPTTAFTINFNSCLYDTLRATDQTNNNGQNITSWNWNFGDTSTDTLQNTSHKYAAAGTYTVSLYTVTDKGCNSDTLTKTTVVNPLPSVGFKYNANFYCETRPVTFTDTSKAGAGNLNRWYWQMGDGRVIDTTNSNPFNHNYAAFGTYTVKLAVQSDKGCKSDTVSKTITINPLPQVGFIVPEICLADAAAQFTDTSKIADGSQASFTYSWNINVTGITPAPTPFTSLTVKNPSAKYFKTDNYQVAETVTSNKGCAVTLQQLFTVNGSIPVPYFAVQNANKLCSNDSVGILDTSYIDFGNITKVDIVWDNVNNPTVKEIDNNPTSGNNKLGKLYKHLYPNFFNPQTAKTYQIKFTAYSGGICVNSITKTITLNPSPRVQFTILPGICNDTVPRQITQATETTGIAGTFVYTGTGVNTTGLFTPNNNPAGTYTIQYKYSSTIGCADSATQPITVWPSPIAKWGISSPTCEKNTITFTDSSVANYKKIKTWAWNYGDGTTATKTDSLPYTYQYAAAGSYNASLRVTTDSGCHSQTNTKIIKVNNLPKVSFTMPTICLPDGNGSFNSTSTIGDNSENLFSYSWNFGDPNNATGGTSQTVSHQYSALPPAGGYPVQLIITSKDGCKDSLTQAYNNVNPQPTAAFTTQPTAVCVRDIISFTDISNGKTSAVSKWYWDVAQGQTSSTQNPSRVFRDSGSYQIRLWVDNAQGCRSDTASQSVTIYPYPILELGPNLVVLEGGTIALKPQIVYGNNLRYAWTVVSPAGSPTYLDSITAAIPKSTPAASVDSLIYKLTLTGIGGCAVTDNVTLVVLKAPIIPNTFSPNGDGQHDRWIIKSLESYPGATIEIYNRNGQIVYKATGYDPNNGWDGTFNGTPLPVGTYYYIINPKNGREILSGSITIIR
jgi:gliding motility-associated-like protein